MPLFSSSYTVHGMESRTYSNASENKLKNKKKNEVWTQMKDKTVVNGKTLLYTAMVEVRHYTGRMLFLLRTHSNFYNI